MKVFLLAILLLIPTIARAASPWPAESNTNALKLTGLDPGFNNNMSGASWNPSNRTFWVCSNSGIFWALVEDGAGSWRIATNAAGTKASWSPGGDLEGICIRDFNSPIVYLMDENGWIREYDVSNFGVVQENRSWDIRAFSPESGSGMGSEGITFVPDEWLQREGYRNSSGQLYTSTNGMGGLMFVGSQEGGYVHVFDLKTNATTYTYLGSNLTSRAETADLNFDRATGELYIWHNPNSVDNFLEVTELNSTVQGSLRKLRTLIEYNGPRTGNLEGFSVGPDATCMVTDDSNANNEGVALYRQFHPVTDTDSDGLDDAWELLQFGSTTVTNGGFLAFAPGDVNATNGVNGADSLLINQVIVGLRSNTSPVFAVAGYTNGDVNQDGSVSGGDPLLMNQTLVGLRGYIVTKIVPSAGSHSVATAVRIYGIGFPTNGITGATIGSPVSVTLSNLVVVSRERIDAVIPAGGGIGTGTVSVIAFPSNNVTSFGKFISQ